LCSRNEATSLVPCHTSLSSYTHTHTHTPKCTTRCVFHERKRGGWLLNHVCGDKEVAGLDRGNCLLDGGCVLHVYWTNNAVSCTTRWLREGKNGRCGQSRLFVRLPFFFPPLTLSSLKYRLRLVCLLPQLCSLS